MREPPVHWDFSAGQRRSVLAVSDGQAGELSSAIALADFHHVGQRRLAEISDRAVLPALCDTLLIDLRGVTDAMADSALAHARGWADDGAAPIVALFGSGQIDLVAAHLLEPRHSLLCEPLVGEIAVALVNSRRLAEMRDVVRSDEAERLRVLNSEVARIAETLARLSRGDVERPTEHRGRERPVDFDEPSPDDDAKIDPRDVRRFIRARRIRESFFAADLFADPAWDMLLDLFAAELEDTRVSVSSLCIAASVPGTTALRWIGTMIDVGLFERQADPLDRRRAYISLTDRARTAMRRYFSVANVVGGAAN